MVINSKGESQLWYDYMGLLGVFLCLSGSGIDQGFMEHLYTELRFPTPLLYCPSLHDLLLLSSFLSALNHILYCLRPMRQWFSLTSILFFQYLWGILGRVLLRESLMSVVLIQYDSFLSVIKSPTFLPAFGHFSASLKLFFNILSRVNNCHFWASYSNTS